MKIHSIFLALAALITSAAFGSEETYTVRRASSYFDNDFSFTVIDGRFAELGTGAFLDKSSTLLLKLGVDERTYYGLITEFIELTLPVEIEAYDNNGAYVGNYNEVLTIQYSPDQSDPGIDLAYFQTSGYHKYVINVDADAMEINGVPVSVVPENIYIEAELKIDRYYELNENTTPTTLGCNYLYYDPSTNEEVVATVAIAPGGSVPGSGELEIWWDYISGAEEYELEWTWVDNYSNNPSSALPATGVLFNRRDFELNNTRVITKAQRYRIPLLFSKGFLIYRVRAVGRFTDNGLADVDIPKYSRWSSDIASLNSPSVAVSAWPHYVSVTGVHEALKNWQYQAVYAEEGKKKEIISYFDGSLRNRQTVTRINSNDEAVIGETIYDNQGRSAIQILPAPVGNTALRYYEKLNQNLSEDPYSHHDFDWEAEAGATNCVAEAMAMTVITGAARYYSNGGVASPNAIENNWQDYVPDANGFPFVQVEYTPDNTGRIRRQSGVGETHTIDGSHATQYFYTQPLQEELDRLFGYKVGYALHYKKNLVVDANGQVSISYIDPQGRVIATALAGDNTDGTAPTGLKTNLLSLAEESGGVHEEVTRDLLGKENTTAPDTDQDKNIKTATGTFGAQADALLLNTQLPVVNDGETYEFTYEITTGTFTDECISTGEYAYPFAYHLDINVTDDCGFTALVSDPVSMYIDGNNPFDDYTGTSGDTYTGGSIPAALDGFTATLNTGAYSVTKLLRVDQAVLDEYAAHYMDPDFNTCLLTYDDFFENNVDHCFDTYPEGSVLEYEDITPCLVTEQMMLADLQPGAQYGGTSANDPLSVFGTPNVLAQGTLTNDEFWQDPDADYLDIYGNTAYVPVTLVSTGVYDPAVVGTPGAPDLIADPDVPGGYLVKPHLLANLDDFLDAWQPSWAGQLLSRHPEYCYLTYLNALCTEIYPASTGISTEVYVNKLRLINTYADAVSTGNFTGVDLTDATEIMDNDPYFNITYSVINAGTGGDGNNLKTYLMGEIMTNYKGNSGLSLWDFAVSSIVCGSDFASTCTFSGSVSGLTTAQQNQIWILYRELYISEKKKIDQLLMNLYAITSGCYNDYIGEITPASMGIAGFMYYPDYVLPSGTPPTYSGQSILAMYMNAIDAYNTLNSTSGIVFPWITAPYALLFADKEKRVIPIDNLYNSSLPEDSAMSELQSEVDANVYQQTGRCDLSFDLEYFIHGFMQHADVTDAASAIPAEEVPLSADLYEALGGDIVTSSGTAVTISTSNASVASELEITVINANGGTGLCPVILDVPGTLDWEDYNEPTAGTDEWVITNASMLYYIPGSFVSGTPDEYYFEILITVLQDGTSTEYVMTGQTCAPIGECSGYEDLDCQRDEQFAAEIAAAFAQVYTNTAFFSVHMEDLGSWYLNSELLHLLRDDPDTPTADLTGDGNEDALVFFRDNGSNDVTITVDFSAAYVPANIELITGSDYDPTTGDLTIYYLDNTGAPLFLTADVDIVIGMGSPELVNLTCVCPEDIAFALAAENLINALLEFTSGETAAVTGLFPYLPEYEAFQDYLIGTPELDLTGFNIWSGDISIAVSGNECGFVMEETGSVLSGDYSELESVFDFVPIWDGFGNPGFGGYGNFDGTDVYIEGFVDRNCIKTNNCNCVPDVAQPVSCNDALAEYNTVITSLNTTLTTAGEDNFPTYTDEEFCATNLAFIVEDYLYYLDEFSITDTDHPQYLTLSQFAMTDLGLVYDLSATTPSATTNLAVDAYVSYVAGHSGTTLTWNNFVNQIYLQDAIFCPAMPPFKPLDITVEYPCQPLTANTDTVNAAQDYEAYLANMEANFRQRYVDEAVASVVENFHTTFDDKEYHYTLYYYDQAGNLVQTVPPKGMDRIEASEIDETDIKTIRASNPSSPAITTDVLPDHNYETVYKYNSLNQLIWQKTPDGGISEFAYDELGRLVVSQNAKQGLANQVSYTKYDALGRIIEVGECDLDANDYMIDDNGKLWSDMSTTPVLVDVSDPTFPLNMATAREEVVVTLYDELTGISSGEFLDYDANNTRNRITGVMYFETYSGGYTNYDNASFYDYDEHGNVKEVLQVNNDADLVTLDQTTKKTDYKYDLVSGNVKEVTYQRGEADQFAHRYVYDADNRITVAETSHDKVIWEKDAKYFYYDHGPLARVEIGDKKVTALDYAYTVQGWLKGVNAEQAHYEKDQGHDGQINHTNWMVGEDVMGFSLHYFEDDYESRTGNNDQFLIYSKGTVAANHIYDLYNGNIKEMYTAATDIQQLPISTSHTMYKYDQLNRIRGMEQEDIESSPITATAGKIQSYYTYDANGNLDTLKRWANISNSKTLIDDFKYGYYSGKNQLKQVDDAEGPPVLITTEDMGDQDTDNYTYTAIGELYSDEQEEIETIDWTVTGKVKRVNRETGSGFVDLEFMYDAIGNRIMKAVYDNNGQLISKTFYVNDAQGNVMSTYRLEEESSDLNLYLSERNIYGSSRLGMEIVEQIIASDNSGNINIDDEMHQITRDKHYELTNHLGNVLQAVYDNKLVTQEESNVINSTFENTLDLDAWIFVAGTGTPEFTYNSGSDQAEVVDGTITLTFPTINGHDYRLEYDVNALAGTTGHEFYLSGGSPSFVSATTGINNQTVTSNGNDLIVEISTTDYIYLDHITVIDLDAVQYAAFVTSQRDYYPFGMLIPARHDEYVGDYRYGFNGMEKDDEVKNVTGSSYDFGARIYDPRVGRWLSTDPHENNYPSLNPYMALLNSPLVTIDPDGRDIIVLSAPNGAAGAGHAAVLIGDDQNGWYFYSKNGTEDHGSSGASYGPDDGIYYQNLNDFANSQSNFDSNGDVYYTSAFRIETSKATDEKMKVAASESVNTDYNLLTASCIDVCSDALEAGNLSGGDPIEGMEPERPNSRYVNITTFNRGEFVTDAIKPDYAVSVAMKLSRETITRTIDDGTDMMGNKKTKTVNFGPSNRALLVKIKFPELFDGSQENNYIKDPSELLDIYNRPAKRPQEDAGAIINAYIENPGSGSKVTGVPEGQFQSP